MNRIHLISLVILVLFTSAVSADVMMLVHGYQSDADDWRRSGVAKRLLLGGWQDAGVIYSVTSKPMLSSLPVNAPKKFYTTQLPAEYPLLLQSKILEAYVYMVTNLYPGERIVLVGHSAGGVIARSMLVNATKHTPVSQLITIASPNLGTDAAKLGIMTANSPLSLFTPFIGAGTINRSEQLYRDLLPEKPGSLLFFLNRQRHPLIEYISIVRKKYLGVPGDFIVSEESQHLEYVFALRNLARSVISGNGHRLQKQDGDTILQLVNGRRLL